MHGRMVHVYRCKIDSDEKTCLEWHNELTFLTVDLATVSVKSFHFISVERLLIITL